jgi:hypothetical protein
VRYPFAAPSRWRLRTSLHRIGTALRGADIAVPSRIERLRVVERGESPRVLRVAIDGDGRTQEVSGTRFAGALELRSTWFALTAPRAAGAQEKAGLLAAPDAASVAGGRPIRGDWTSAAATLAVCAALLAVALRLRRRRPLAEGGHAEVLERVRGHVGEELR